MNSGIGAKRIMAVSRPPALVKSSSLLVHKDKERHSIGLCVDGQGYLPGVTTYWLKRGGQGLSPNGSRIPPAAGICFIT